MYSQYNLYACFCFIRMLKAKNRHKQKHCISCGVQEYAVSVCIVCAYGMSV